MASQRAGGSNERVSSHGHVFERLRLILPLYSSAAAAAAVAHSLMQAKVAAERLEKPKACVPEVAQDQAAVVLAVEIGCTGESA